MNIINILYYLSLNRNIICVERKYITLDKKNSILLQNNRSRYITINCYINKVTAWKININVTFFTEMIYTVYVI